MTEHTEYLHFHGFCGSGGGAKGFNQGAARLGNRHARLRCIGGFDVDPAAVRDFGRLAGVPGTVLDLFSRDQYKAFHGHEPPPGWREATPDDIRKAANGERPHIFFCSAPCKGFSGLLSEARSREPRYQALNQLALRALWLVLEAWSDDPPELILFENVPRIITRGSELIEQIRELLLGFGYAVATPPDLIHDCGELGNLAQSRKRFLLVARYVAKVPPFLYQPPKRPLRAVGEILGRMPLPGDPRGGPMHRIPRLQWKTWVRLGFVEAGSDWRSLNKLRVVDGRLADYLLVPEYRDDAYGVMGWEENAMTISGRSSPTNGRYSVADPRAGNEYHHNVFHVVPWAEHRGTITSGHGPSSGAQGVADPRTSGAYYDSSFRVVPWGSPRGAVTSGDAPSNSGGVADPRFTGEHAFGQWGVREWDEPAATVTAQRAPGQGPISIADPRLKSSADSFQNIYRIIPFDEPCKAVTGASHVAGGAACVADPRIGEKSYQVKKYKVTQWGEPTRTVIGASTSGDGAFAVADPRFPAASDKLVCMIRSLDNTWHRPFTTLELAALQSLLDPEEEFNLDGNSDSSKRERIGNAVPPAAAEAIASVMAQTLLLAASGETFQLSATPVWVRPVVVALTVKTER